MDRRICIYSNNTDQSRSTEELLRKCFEKEGITAEIVPSDKTDLLVVIGGDGSMLDAIHKFDFPTFPVIGINTGHLGFFQELAAHQVGMFIERYEAGKFNIQESSVVEAEVFLDGRQEKLKGLNEIVIRGTQSYSTHLNISIGDSFIENFSGDGILVATSSGSTAYNYSVGGAIVDPRLDVLQVTPIAPMNTTAYRSFTSSLILPPELSLEIVPQYKRDVLLYVMNDGIEHRYSNVTRIKVSFSPAKVDLLRFDSYDFWNKVKTKFL